MNQQTQFGHDPRPDRKCGPLKRSKSGAKSSAAIAEAHAPRQLIWTEADRRNERRQRSVSPQSDISCLPDGNQTAVPSEQIPNTGERQIGEKFGRNAQIGRSRHHGAAPNTGTRRSSDRSSALSLTRSDLPGLSLPASPLCNCPPSFSSVGYLWEQAIGSQ